MATVTRFERPIAPVTQERVDVSRVVRRQGWVEGINVRPPPAVLSISVVGVTIVVSWSSVPNALSYNVYRATNVTGPFTLLANTTSLSYTDSNPVPGTTYYYQISAINNFGESVPQGPISAMVQSPPTIVNVTPPAGTPILPSASISFDMLVPEGIRLAIILANIGGVQEVIHDGVAFDPRYVTGSQRTAITNGFHYVVTRNGGWAAPPTITPYVVDLAGLEN